KKDSATKPAKASQEKADTDREKSPRAEPPVKKAKEELPKADSVKASSSQKDEKALGTPRKAHPKGTKDHPESRPAKEEKAKKDHAKEVKSEKTSNKDDKSKKTVEKSKSSEAKTEKRKRKAEEKADKEHEAPLKVSKPETAESKTSPKGKTEPDGEKGERTPEKDKSGFLITPAKKIKLNRETGKKIVSAENVPPAKEPVEKAEPSSSKAKQEKVKGKARRKVTAADGSSSTLVDYASTSSTGGSPVRKPEEKTDTKRTVIKTMEEYNNDITAPAEDVIIMIQVPQSKWDKDDFESEEEDIKSTQPPANIGKPTSVVKNVSAKPPNPLKHNEKEMEPLEKIQKTAKEPSYESSQHDAKSSKSSVLNEKGKTKERDHSASDKDASEKRKSSVQPEKDHSERAAEQGNGKSTSQSSKDSRSSEKHDAGRGSAAKDFTPNRDKKSDHESSREHSSSKRRDEKSELARRKESPSRTRESTSGQKSKPRDDRAEPSKKGTGDSKRSSYSPPRERKQPDHKAAHDSKRSSEEHKPLDKNSGKEKEKEKEKDNKEREPVCSEPSLRQESPDTKNEKENVTGQNDKAGVKAKPPVSNPPRLSSDPTRETDEAAFVPDYNESDSESNVSAKDEETAGKSPKEQKEKAIETVKEDAAAPAAAEQPEAGRSQSQSSPSVSRSRSQSPSESQTRSHSSSASSGESQDSKKK
ncbi:RBBP6 ligase, partial [Alectura lathami]|nr:RBBP6 ligase [Alectura lathami]